MGLGSPMIKSKLYKGFVNHSIQAVNDSGTVFLVKHRVIGSCSRRIYFGLSGRR